MAYVPYAYWSRYRPLGIMLGGGAGFWFEKAVQAETEDEARAYLRRVIDGTEYGVNLLENLVRDLDDRETRLRMWLLLSDVAPNENWRGQYAYDREQDLAGAPP